MKHQNLLQNNFYIYSSKIIIGATSVCTTIALSLTSQTKAATSTGYLHGLTESSYSAFYQSDTPVKYPLIRCDFDDESSKIKKKRTRIKTLVSDFWHYTVNRIETYPENLKLRGFVIGDPHLGNIDVFYSRFTKPSFRLTFNDMDEAGYNYLVGDYLKLMAYALTLKKNALDLDQLSDSYIKGLSGIPQTIPKDIQKLLNQSPTKYFKAQSKYLDKLKQKGTQLALTELSQDEKETQAELANTAVIKNLQLTGAWVDERTTGSSAGMNRYLFSGINQIELQDGTREPIGVEGAVEYKELTCTATGNSDEQNLALDLDRFSVYDASFHKLPLSQTLFGQQAVVYINGHYFLARVKVPNLYKELGIESAQTAKLQEHLNYLAWFLGSFHRGNTKPDYIEAIKTNRDFLKKEASNILKNFSKVK